VTASTTAPATLAGSAAWPHRPGAETRAAASDFTTRLAQVRGELAAPVFRGSPQARDLGDRIEEFGRTAVTTGLHALSG
jgi:hypothetical protein